MTSVGRLWRYPVKSMQGEEVDEIALSATGVVGDRAYGFLDVETGDIASAKQSKHFGPLLGCRARFLDTPTANGAPPIEVTFPNGTVVQTDTDGGEELVRHVSTFLNRQVRFVPAEPDALGFVDLAQVHVLAASTLRRLSNEHPGGHWDPRRMRPNVLLDDVDPLANEDDWLGCDVHLGEHAVVHLVIPTPRCVMTTLSQPGLPKDGAMLKAIARLGLKDLPVLGQSACAGWYADIVSPGIVRRGEPVRVQRVAPRKGAIAATIDL
jgi:MOSC domain-containing protein